MATEKNVSDVRTLPCSQNFWVGTYQPERFHPQSSPCTFCNLVNVTADATYYVWRCVVL